MSKLIEILLKETKSLKEQYLEKVEIWSKEEKALHAARKAWKEVDWCKFFKLEPRLVNEGSSSEFLTFPKGFYNTKEYGKYDRLKTQAYRAFKLTEEEYVATDLKAAERHYQSSIEKLAARIEKKELDQSKLKATTSHIGVNIDTVLTDGDKTVRAYTIIASGPVQKPHYRYLIK